MIGFLLRCAEVAVMTAIAVTVTIFVERAASQEKSE
jgi:hypothetical protein